MSERDGSSIDRVGRMLVEVQVSDPAGAMIADGRFVIKLPDGVGRLTERLRPLQDPFRPLHFDLRLSELLSRSERDELEELRALLRSGAKAPRASDREICGALSPIPVPVPGGDECTLPAGHDGYHSWARLG